MIVGCCVFMLFFGITLGCTASVYVAEMAKPKIIKLTTIVNWVVGAIIGILFPILVGKYGYSGPTFTFLCDWCLISFIINCKLGRETKGKNRVLVEEEYKKMKIC